MKVYLVMESFYEYADCLVGVCATRERAEAYIVFKQAEYTEEPLKSGAYYIVEEEVLE